MEERSQTPLLFPYCESQNQISEVFCVKINSVIKPRIFPTDKQYINDTQIQGIIFIFLRILQMT